MVSRIAALKGTIIYRTQVDFSPLFVHADDLGFWYGGFGLKNSKPKGLGFDLRGSD